MPDKDVGENDPNRSTDRLLGELIAEVRALKHSENNTSTKVDAVGRQVAPIPGLVKEVAEIKAEQDRHNFRLGVLEADKNRREGAIGLVAWTARHWPLSLIMAALAVWAAWLNGKLG